MLTRFTDPRFGDLGLGVPALGDLRREIDRLFTDFDRGLDPGEARFGDAAFGPRASLRDDGENLVLRAELPGFREEDVDVSLERGVLTIRGERKVETPEGYDARLRERRAVRFSRSFALPARIEADRAHAALRDGVLTLTLPKSAEERPTKVTVRAG